MRRKFAGSTDQYIDVFVANSSLTTGAGLTGLVFNSSGLKCYWRNSINDTPNQLTLVTQTVAGAHTDGGFVELDSANMPGWYRLDLSDDMVSMEGDLSLMLLGAANMAPVPVGILIENADFHAQRHLLYDVGTEIFGANDWGNYVQQAAFGIRLRKNTAFANFHFAMRDTSGNLATGLTVTAERLIDAGAFAACANAVVEESAGLYRIDLATTDLNGECITFKFTAAAARPTLITIITNPNAIGG